MSKDKTKNRKVKNMSTKTTDRAPKGEYVAKPIDIKRPLRTQGFSRLLTRSYAVKEFIDAGLPTVEKLEAMAKLTEEPQKDFNLVKDIRRRLEVNTGEHFEVLDIEEGQLIHSYLRGPYEAYAKQEKKDFTERSNFKAVTHFYLRVEELAHV